METGKKTLLEKRAPVGSALILTVVLTSLLAIVAVLFVLAARIDKMATSAISENKELNFAVDTVIARISEELVSDSPGVAGQEYYDYPDEYNTWLASLEPYDADPDPSVSDWRWRQISDIYNKFRPQNLWDMQPRIVDGYQEAVFVNDSNTAVLYPADADGDGVCDSAWVKLKGMTSSKGKPVYVAVRIVDNGGKLNVNTAYKFDPTDPNAAISNIDGSSQLQINLMALAGHMRKTTPLFVEDELALLAARANYAFGVGLAALPSYQADLAGYAQNVIWRYDMAGGSYTPFDISDELELCNRFLINHEDIKTRVEKLWTWSFNSPSELNTPVQRGGSANMVDWFSRAQHDPVDPNYSYRHIGTTYNIDRIIDPNGDKMFNVNAVPDAQLLYGTLINCINFNLPAAPALAAEFAQLAANIKDYSDNDSVVSIVTDVNGNPHFGFEAQPFISEIAFRISDTDANNPANNYFALELYNPFRVDIPLGDFRVELRRQNMGLVSTIRLTGYVMAADSRFVITNGPGASTQFGVTGLMSVGRGAEDPNLVLATYVPRGTDPETYRLSENYVIYLLRTTIATPNLYLDRQTASQQWFDWDSIKGVTQSYGRPDNDWNIVYQNLQPVAETLGAANGVVGGRKNYNIAKSMGRFVTVGDASRMLTIGPSTDLNNTIGTQLAMQPSEEQVRCDLHNPVFASIFRYLTVFDPALDGIDNDGDGLVNEIDPNLTPEFQVIGRINVNTAPWFAIAQLPWMRPEIAQAIVAYRDKKPLLDNQGDLIVNYADRTAATGSSTVLREDLGLASTGELAAVVNRADNIPNYRNFSMRYYVDGADQRGFPDLTTDSSTGRDGAADDFEERDLIFSRISNLVTVRSDVFTAYILVRIGTDGPQKRVVAILDRSNVYSPSDKVRIIALHPVADPR